jgi:hypothetical protein
MADIQFVVPDADNETIAYPFTVIARCDVSSLFLEAQKLDKEARRSNLFCPKPFIARLIVTEPDGDGSTPHAVTIDHQFNAAPAAFNDRFTNIDSDGSVLGSKKLILQLIQTFSKDDPSLWKVLSEKPRPVTIV